MVSSATAAPIGVGQPMANGEMPKNGEKEANQQQNNKNTSTSPMDPSGATTTTISTIAVRAEPHSTVVVALLKSIDYVDLRIDKMRPGLMEIGSTVQENAQLLLIHTDLFQRLMSKQEQVEELLGTKVQQLVQEQTEPGDVLVYEAMADGLAMAWKGLKRQLEMRGYILTDTQRLHDLAIKHEELSKLLNSRLQIEGEPKGGVLETQRIVNELVELTRDGMDIGSCLITQIRILGSLADNVDRPREVFEACLEIERLMLKMAQSWELLESEWRNLKPQEEEQPRQKTTQIMGKAGKTTAGDDNFMANLDVAEQWLREAQRQFDGIRREEETVEEEGDGDQRSQKLQLLTDQIKANQASLQVLAERIYAKCTELPPEMSTRCADLLEQYNRLMKEAQNRVDLVEKSRQWIRDADALLLQLAKMREELGTADESMAGELGPLAQQKGVALIERGEQLCAQWIVEGAGVAIREKINEKVQRLKEAVIEVVRLARERMAAGKAQKLLEKIISLERWCRSTAGPFLSEPIVLAPIVAETSDFIGRHRQFAADLRDKEQQLQSLFAHQKMLSEGELDRLASLQARMAQLREIVERRLQLGKKMEQLLKLSREMGTSIHFLTTLLQENQHQHGGQQPTAQNIDQQIRHLLQSLNENCIQESHQADNFQVLANTGAEADPDLDLTEALNWSRAQIAAHQQEYAKLSEQCKLWERRVLAKEKPPQFVVTLPNEKLIWEGQRVELMAKIEGSPEPRVFWLKEVPEEEGGRMRQLEVLERGGQCRIGWLNGVATLIIEEAVAEDGGEYILRAENDHGCAEGRIKLVVKANPQSPTQLLGDTIIQRTSTTTTMKTTTKRTTTMEGGEEEQQQQEIVEELGEFKPRFVKQLQNVSVRDGEQFQLDCVVMGNPEPKIIWYREEQTVRESTRVHLSFSGDHCTLTCTNASSEDAGLYKVLALNVHGETMNFCRVCIVPPSPKRKMPPPTAPKPTTPVQMRTTTTETTVMTTTGQQQHQRQLHHEQQQFEEQRNQQQVQQQQQEHLEQQQLLLETEQQQLQLLIQERQLQQKHSPGGTEAIPPSLEPQLCSQVAHEGQHLVFQTIVLGQPIPQVHWYYNGQQITMGRPDLAIHRDLQGRCSLTIPCALLRHAGQYMIEAKNEFGQSTSGATLNVLLAIGGPKNPLAEIIQMDSEFYQKGGGGGEIMSEQQGQQQFFSTTHKHNIYAQQQQQQFMMVQQQQQQEEVPNGGGGQTAFSSSRWSNQSPSQGPVYAVSKSERAESRRTSSDMGDPGYSSLANAPECLRPFPAEVTVNEGDKADIDCLMLGNPRPKIQWFFNGRPIKSSHDFVQFTNVGDSYCIHFGQARLEMAGWYRLVAENVKGRSESLTLIHVRPKSMIPKPAATAIGGGYHQRGARRSIGGVQGLLQWQKQKMLQQQQTRALSTPPRPFYADNGGTAPSTSPSPWAQQQHQQQQQQFYMQQRDRNQRETMMMPPDIMSTSAYLPRDDGAERIQGAHDFMRGNQALVESVSEHRLISTEQLLLAESGGTQPQPKGSPPHFMQTLVSAVVSEGQSARFEAVVTGLPQPRLEWTKDGQILSENANLRIWTEGARATLIINEIGPSEAGKYCCMAENPAGMASSSAQLLLRPKTMAPDFVERLVSEEVEEGAPLKWTVRVSGEPEPTVIWLRDGQTFVEVDGVRMVKEAPFTYSLVIDSLQMIDAGQFTCLLENIAGEARSTADLVVRQRGAPPGKYVHVTKVTQEKQVRADELARNETVTIEGGQLPSEYEGDEEEEEEE